MLVLIDSKGKTNSIHNYLTTDTTKFIQQIECMENIKKDIAFLNVYLRRFTNFALATRFWVDGLLKSAPPNFDTESRKIICKESLYWMNFLCVEYMLKYHNMCTKVCIWAVVYRSLAYVHAYL